MRFRSLLVASGLAVAALTASAASAATGWTTADVNMRSCASTRCARILTIPAHAQIWVNSCNGWCDVEYAGRRGFVFGRYVVVGDAVPPPPPPPLIYEAPTPYYWWYDDDFHRPPVKRPRPHKPRRPPKAHPKPPAVHPKPPRPPRIDRPPRLPSIERPPRSHDHPRRRLRPLRCDPKTGICR